MVDKSKYVQGLFEHNKEILTDLDESLIFIQSKIGAATFEKYAFYRNYDYSSLKTTVPWLFPKHLYFKIASEDLTRW